MNIPITIVQNDDGTYTVIGNGIPFTTEGATLEEALANAREAADCHIEGMQKRQDPDESAYLQSLGRSFQSMLAV